jgi:hypothetical protein
MITIYRRAQVIARCERAEVLAGLKSGRFEPTDHYESPETEGWISLAHFESRAYERKPPTERPNQATMICSYGDTVEPDPTHRPIKDLDQLGEMLRLMEAARPKVHPKPAIGRRDDTGPNPILGLLRLLASPFVLLSQLSETLADLIGTILAKVALHAVTALIFIAVICLSFYAPPVTAVCVALFLLLRKRE